MAEGEREKERESCPLEGADCLSSSLPITIEHFKRRREQKTRERQPCATGRLRSHRQLLRIAHGEPTPVVNTPERRSGAERHRPEKKNDQISKRIGRKWRRCLGKEVA